MLAPWREKEGNHECNNDRNCADSLLQIPEIRVIPKTHIDAPKKPFFRNLGTIVPNDVAAVQPLARNEHDYGAWRCQPTSPKKCPWFEWLLSTSMDALESSKSQFKEAALAGERCGIACSSSSSTSEGTFGSFR